MAYFKDKDENTFVFPDGVEIHDGLVEITEAEVESTRESRWPKGQEALFVHKASAMSALSSSDTTLMRCYEEGIPLPVEWVAYRKALRATISAQSGDPTNLCQSNQNPQREFKLWHI